jgi:eukaryotic-like serine/threonine-protein kinase
MKDGSASEPLAAATLTGHFAAAELRSGDVLAGRFRIEALIGMGGMGVVYRARDLSLDIDVAIKLLRPELARRPDAFAGFRRELLLARQVSSPHVVRIHDIAEHEGRWFISMDWIRGESLERRRDRLRRLPLEQVLAITRGLLEGLSAAHQRGVVHRDLKPANVLLDESDHACITDFGVARILGSTGMTQTGMIVGTSEYLSPEQARGGTIDARSDLYAVGLIFHELLSGELPFSGGTPAEAVIQRVLRAPPSLARIRPDLPGWVHAFGARLLKADPAHRFGSARAALHALDARRVPRAPLDRRVLACVAAALLVAAAGTAWWRLRPPAAPVAAVVPATPRIGVLPIAVPAGDVELARAARALEEHLHAWLRSDAVIAAIPRRRLLDARARTAPDLEGDALLRQLPDIANAAKADRLAQGRLRRDGSQLVLDLAWSATASQPLAVRGDDSAALFRAYLAAAPAWLAGATLHVGAAPALPPAAFATLGEALLDLDRKDAPAAAAVAWPTEAVSASPLVARSVLDAQEAAGQMLPARNTRDAVLKRFAGDGAPLARELRVRALAANGEGASAVQAVEAAVQAFPHDPELALLDASLLADNGQGAAALQRLHSYTVADDQDARAWFLLGKTAIQQGQAQPAVDEYLVRALVLDTRARNGAAEAETRNALGIGYERLGQLDAASEQYQRAAAMRDTLHDDGGLARTLRNLAIVQAERGQRDEAGRTLDRARSLLEGIGDRASLADLENDRGVVAEERGDFAAALAAYRRALVLRQQLDTPDAIAESLNNVGFSSFRLGQFDNALVYWQQASALYRTLGDNDGTLRIEQSIGLLDIARGHFVDARTRLKASLRDAEDRQLSEEASAGHVDLAELSLLEGRLADALEHARAAGRIAARRSDQRTQAEAMLLQVRIALALGDGEGADAALHDIAPDRLNNDQRAIYHLAVARRKALAGEGAAARSALDTAARDAEEAHGGKLALEIRLERARLDLADGHAGRARATLASLHDDAALGEVPARLEWMQLSIAAALREGARAAASRTYHDALMLMKGIDHYGPAWLLHAMGAQALADPGEAAAARSAAAAARGQLVADAPADARAQLEQALARRLHEEAGIDHAP